MSPDQPAGLVDSARRLAGAVVESVGTRLELGATELLEARLNLAQRFIAAASALFLLGNGLIAALVALAWWAGPANGAWVLGGGAALLLLAAGGALWRWHWLARTQPPLLGDTMAQLRADARALAGE